jgi:ubiquitin-protein ligase E3 C
MFNQQEVQVLIGGVNSPIDLDDLQRHTNYGGLYDEKHETIVAFWKVKPVPVSVSLLLFG